MTQLNFLYLEKKEGQWHHYQIKVIGNTRGNKITSQIIQLISLCQIKLIKSLSKVSPFYSSAPSMFTNSQPKTGIDWDPFYIDIGSNLKKLWNSLCPRFQKMDKIILNQLCKSSKKVTLEHLRSTNNFEFEILNSKISVSSRTISWMGSWNWVSTRINLIRTHVWSMCCNDVTKSKRSAWDEIDKKMWLSFKTFKRIQPPFMCRFGSFVVKKTMSSSRWLMSATLWTISKNWFKIWVTFLTFNNAHFSNNCCVIL